MNVLQEILSRQKEFHDGLSADFEEADLLSALVIQLADRIVDNSDSHDEAKDLGKLISEAILTSIDARFRDDTLNHVIANYGMKTGDRFTQI